MNHKSSEIKEFIANTQLWRGLPEDQLEAIVKIAIAKTYTKSEIIFQEGDEGIGFFVVKSGQYWSTKNTSWLKSDPLRGFWLEHAMHF